MYLRQAHAETHIPTIRQFIVENPLGIITTAIRSSLYPLLQCSHIPWLLDLQDPTSETEMGILRGHMARPNPHVKAMIEEVKANNEALPSSDGTSSTEGRKLNQLTEEVMILFNGPAHHYVTPKFYTTTKPSTGKVVPTWNYSAAQVYGRATIYWDSHAEVTGSFLTKQISDLSHHAEHDVMGFTGQKGAKKEWTVNDAPERFIELLKKNIIGIEVQITRLEGKWKMSQELGVGDREGVIKGFTEMGGQTAEIIADTVKVRGERKDREIAEAKAK